MSIPATAGGFLTEARLRGFVRCSELYHLGGEYPIQPQTEIIQYTIEKMISAWMRQKLENPREHAPQYIVEILTKLDKKHHWLPQQIDRMQQRSAWALHNLFQIIDPLKYIPVMGPIESTLMVSKTPLRLHLSGILRTDKNMTLHIIDFSPYRDQHAVSNDPIAHLKLKMLDGFVQKHHARANAKLHSFAISDNSNLIYNSISTAEINESQIRRAESLVKLMESGYHFPVLPCNYQCPFRSKCKP